MTAQANRSAEFIKKTGDTMSGTLTVFGAINSDGALYANKTIGLKVKSITDLDSPYTANEEVVILADATNGNITITMPPVSTSVNISYYIKKKDGSTNTITIDGDSSETIDGEDSQTLKNRNECITLVCDNTGWYII